MEDGSGARISAAKVVAEEYLYGSEVEPRRTHRSYGNDEVRSGCYGISLLVPVRMSTLWALKSIPPSRL
jgi:hypothetical protein